MSRLKLTYEEKIIPALIESLKIKNKMALPKLDKVTVNVGIGKERSNEKFQKNAIANLEAITGQKAVIKKARKAISGFKVREGDEVGLMVTLRKEKMYDFVDKLANITLPRLRDFRGLDEKSFDQSGNYTLGVKEQVIFPEVTHETSENVHGLEITFVIKNGSKENSKELLKQIGFPFKDHTGSSKPLDIARGGEVKNG